MNKGLALPSLDSNSAGGQLTGGGNPDREMKQRPGSSTSSDNNQDLDVEPGIKFKDWGFKVDRLFDVAYRFFKRNESKAFHPSFDVRNQMNALILQARYGNFDGDRAPDIGTLDLIGKSRRHAWSLLKGMSKTEAMSKFICTLDEICPLFKPYTEAVKISSGMQSQLEEQTYDKSNGGTGQSQSEKDEQLKAIHTSLCKQTYNQFKGYAEKQYPDETTKQKTLIASLQEQYYQQYISQLHRTESGANHNDVDDSHQLLSPSNPNTLDATLEDRLKKVTTNDDLGALTDRCSSNSLPKNQDQEKPIDVGNQELNQTMVSMINKPIIAQHQAVNTSDQKDHPPHSNNLLITTPTDASKCMNLHSPNSQNNSSAMIDSLTSSGNCDNKIVPTDQASQACNTRVYQNVALKSIGTFESYPEPRPIQGTYSRPTKGSVVIDLFNGADQKYQQLPPSSLYGSVHSQSSPQNFPTANLPPTYEPPSYQPTTNSDLQHSLQPPVPQLPPEITQMSERHHYNNDAVDNNQQLVRSAVDEWSCKSSSEGGSPLQQSMSYEPLEPATIWTKRGVNEFKDSLTDDKHGGAFVVKQGTLLTIQVPTYPDGRYIYWEFATEDYDIGFGLDFVHDTSLTKPLAIKIQEEVDEDDEDNEYSEYDDADGGVCRAEEAGGSSDAGRINGLGRMEALDKKRSERFARLANTVSILPIYRRDSHEEVFVGRHRYPGQGYYVLKFDNTYSVLRSKSLFFRICYFI